MSRPDMENLERLLSEATDPPHWSLATLTGCLRILDTDGGIVATVSEATDAALIVAMREALPGLIVEVREAARLRKLFDDAGQGEHNVLALVEHYQARATEADERLALAYPKALQAAAGVVLANDHYTREVAGFPADSPEVRSLADYLADAILELSQEQIDAVDAAQAEMAAGVHEHFVCPGCHVVDDEPCLPGCIDAEIEGERRTPFDGFSEFMADDEGDEPEEGGTP